MAEAEAKVQGAPGADAAKELVRYEVRDGVALLTLNDPPANTYSYDMMRALEEFNRLRVDQGP